MACDARKWSLGLGISGLAILLFGVILGYVAVPSIVRSKIAEILPLRPKTESWDRWENLPVPIQYRIFVFNVNNPEEILKGGKPNVTEVGPYVYREKRVKNVLSVDEDNGTVEYEQKMLFEFDAEASAPLKEDDVLMVVNAPAMLFGLVVDNLKKINPVIGLYDTAIEKMWPYSNSLFFKTKVKDYLFDGIPINCVINEPSRDIDKIILCEAFKILHPKTTILHGLGKDIHSFSFFKYKIDSTDGVYKIDLGIRDVTNIGQILSWNGRNSLSLWKDDSCNRITGTDATVFRPYLEQDDVKSLKIFHSDICRSVSLVYEKDTEFKGVKGRRYVPDKSFFASVSDEPENHCFCPQSLREVTHYAGCLKSGVLELSGCQGAPVIVSYPHFLQADPVFQGKVDGLAPDIDKHRIFLDLEPNTGYPLRAGSRVQINAFLKRIQEVRVMKNLPNVLMPMIWLEEKVELTDELIDTINSQMLNLLRIADIIKWLLIGVGICLATGSFGYYIIQRLRQRLVPKVTAEEFSNFLSVISKGKDPRRLRLDLFCDVENLKCSCNESLKGDKNEFYDPLLNKGVSFGLLSKLSKTDKQTERLVWTRFSKGIVTKTNLCLYPEMKLFQRWQAQCRVV